jgi:hypothetical protein
MIHQYCNNTLVKLIHYNNVLTYYYNNLFLRSRSSHTKLVYETPLFVGQGTPSAQQFDS